MTCMLMVASAHVTIGQVLQAQATAATAAAPSAVRRARCAHQVHTERLYAPQGIL